MQGRARKLGIDPPQGEALALIFRANHLHVRLGELRVHAREHLALLHYLTLADAYPLTDYFPVLDPMPEGYRFRDCWPETTRGGVDGSARDDDIDYAILALHLLETHGRALRPEHVGSAWTELFPLRQEPVSPSTSALRASADKSRKPADAARDGNGNHA